MESERQYQKALGKTIKTFRGVRTQKELAEGAGIPTSTLSKIEQGRQIPRAATIAKIACGLGLSAVKLEQRVAAQMLSSETSPASGLVRKISSRYL